MNRPVGYFRPFFALNPSVVNLTRMSYVAATRVVHLLLGNILFMAGS